MMDFDDHMTSEDTKRTNRNNAEKKRRDQFNTLLTELGNILNVMPEATSATAVAAAAAAAEDTASIASRSERGNTTGFIFVQNENGHLFSSSLPRLDKCHKTSRIFPRTEQTFASARSFGVIS